MKKKYIFLGLLASVMLMGCSQSSNNSHNTDKSEKEVVYTQSTSNKQTDSITEKEIEVLVNNEIVLLSKENKISKVTIISKGDYSNASNEYFEKVMESIKKSDSGEIKGVNLQYEVDGKTNKIETTYNLLELIDELEKNRLYMTCGLDPELYNEDGTYPLDKLVQTLEENGYTKKS